MISFYHLRPGSTGRTERTQPGFENIHGWVFGSRLVLFCFLESKQNPLFHSCKLLRNVPLGAVPLLTHR